MPSSRSHVRTQVTWIAMMDLACLVVGSFIGVVVRLGPEEVTVYVFEHLEGWILFFGILVTIFAFMAIVNPLIGASYLVYTLALALLFLRSGLLRGGLSPPSRPGRPPRRAGTAPV